MMAPTPSAPTSEAPQPCWKTATRMPYAAPTDSRLSTIEVSATVSERKDSSISRKAKTTTKAKTGRTEPTSWSLKSLLPAT